MMPVVWLFWLFLGFFWGGGFHELSITLNSSSPFSSQACSLYSLPLSRLFPHDQEHRDVDPRAQGGGERARPYGAQ